MSEQDTVTTGRPSTKALLQWGVVGTAVGGALTYYQVGVRAAFTAYAALVPSPYAGGLLAAIFAGCICVEIAAIALPDREAPFIAAIAAVGSFYPAAAAKAMGTRELFNLYILSWPVLCSILGYVVARGLRFWLEYRAVRRRCQQAALDNNNF